MATFTPSAGPSSAVPPPDVEVAPEQIEGIHPELTKQLLQKSSIPGVSIVRQQFRHHLASILRSMRRNGWVGRPLLAQRNGDRYKAWTGGTRLEAATRLGLNVPLVLVNAAALIEEGWTEGDLLRGGWRSPERLGADPRSVRMLELESQEQAKRGF